MSQRSRPPGISFGIPVCLGCCLLAFTSGCHRSSGLDELDAGVDASEVDALVIDSAPPFDAGVRDARVVDTAEFDAGLDVPEPCPEPSLMESFHPAADETRYGRALALSGDGSTLAVSSQDSLSIYDRDAEGEWLRVYRRTVVVSDPDLYAPGAVDIDDSGDTVIWGNSISTEASPDYSAALVFERQAGGEWRETTIERTPDTFVVNTGVSISGDGSTLAVRDDGGAGGLHLQLFERTEAGEWQQSHVIAWELGSSDGNTVELSEAGDRVLWLTRPYDSFAIHRREASGEWTLEFEVSDFGPSSPVLDAAGGRVVVRDTGPDAIIVYDRTGTTWAETSRFPLSFYARLVPPPVAVAPSGEEIYVSASTECGVAVLSWTQRGSDWVEATTRQTGVLLDANDLRLSLSAADDGTVALTIPDDHLGGERTPPEAVGVYLFR